MSSRLSAQNCDNIISNFSGGLYLITDPSTGDTLFNPGTENRIYLTSGMVTGDLMLFRVTAGYTYLWTTEIFNSIFFDSFIRVWDATDPSFPLVAQDDDGSGYFSGNSTLIWTACKDGYVWVSVNDWECDNLGTPFNLLSAAIPGNPLTLDGGLDQSAFNGYTPVQTELNYLVGSAVGGDPPYIYDWAGPDIHYQGLTNGSGVAVRPTLQGANSYYVNVTDASGCTQRDTVLVNLIDIACPSGSRSGSRSGSSGDWDMDPGSGSNSGSGRFSTESCEAPKVDILICAELRSCSASGSGSGSYDFEQLEVLPNPGSHSNSRSGSRSGSNSGSGSGSTSCMQSKCIKYDPCGRRDRVVQALAQSTNNHLGPCSNTAVCVNEPFPPSTMMEMDLVSDFFANETSWEITNSEGEVIFEGGPGLVDPQVGSSSSSAGAHYVTLSHFGFSQEIEDLRSIQVDPNECYTLTMRDQFGDGMCCLFGQGDYILSFDNMTTFVSSGQFPNAEVTEFGGAGCPTGTTYFKTQPESEAEIVPTVAQFLRAIPNPTQSHTTFEIGISGNTQARLEVFNLYGQRIALLLDQELPEGVHAVDFDVSQLNAGIYIYRLSTPSGALDGKLVIQR